MGTKTLITPEQYLATHYEREPEYVRGELKEKALPDRLHGRIQMLLGILLNSMASRHNLSVESEVRCRLAPDVYRIPDIALFDLRKPFDLLPTEAPLLVVEIVSRDERYTELVEKLQDDEKWGVPRIWIVNPWNSQLAFWKSGAMQTVEALTMPEFGFEVRMDQLLEGIDLPK
jgi:Uma2 family endonuclease